MRKYLIASVLLAAAVLLLACQRTSSTGVNTTNTSTTATGIANPASEFCVSHGGRLDIRSEEPDGGQVGFCVFPNGKQCEEWTYYRGECQP